MPSEAIAGPPSGSTTRVNSRSSPAPSSRAASSSSRGISAKKLRSRKIANGSPKATWKSTTPMMSPKIPIFAEQLRHRDQRHLHRHHQQRHDDQEPPVAAGEVHPGEGVAGQRADHHHQQRRRHGDQTVFSSEPVIVVVVQERLVVVGGQLGRRGEDLPPAATRAMSVGLRSEDSSRPNVGISQNSADQEQEDPHHPAAGARREPGRGPSASRRTAPERGPRRRAGSRPRSSPSLLPQPPDVEDTSPAARAAAGSRRSRCRRPGCRRPPNDDRYSWSASTLASSCAEPGAMM